MIAIKAGDMVTHVDKGFWPEPCRVERVDSETFPEDPVAFFCEGGFWRTSRLIAVVVPANQTRSALRPSLRCGECPCGYLVLSNESNCPECRVTLDWREL